MKRVLISVFDKTGLIEFARFLIENEWEIIATKGTSKFLEKNKIQNIPVENLIDFPELLELSLIHISEPTRLGMIS